MGTLTDAGLIIDGKVPDESFAAYVDDVIKMLQTGAGIFPQGVICNKEIKPNPAAKDLDLNNKKLFPDFHKIWRPRFEKMVLYLDKPGDFLLAKNGLVPLIDPTAIATLLGAKPADLTIPAILTQMTTGAPALIGLDNGLAYFTLNFKLNPADLAVPNLIDMGKKILAAIAIPPIPPIPPLPPNPILLKFGYTEQFNFDLNLGLAPFKSKIKLAVPALLLKEMPGLFMKFAQGDIIGGLVKFMCDQISADQPESMSTSDIEIAAQQILQQYQVKYQTVSFVGELIGNGAVTKALAQPSSSTNPGGLSLIRKPSTETVSYISTGTGGAVGSLRAEIRALIVGVVGDYDLNKSVSADKSKVGGDKTNSTEISPDKIPSKEKVNETATTEATATAKAADEKTGYVPEVAFEVKKSPADKKLAEAAAAKAEAKAKKIEDDKPRATPADMLKASKLLIGPDGKFIDNAPKWALEIGIEALKDLPNRVLGFTSCGKFVGNIFEQWFAKNLIQSNNPAYRAYNNTNKFWQKDAPGKGNPYGLGNSHTLAQGGLISYMNIGLVVEQDLNLAKNSVWICADPRVDGPSVAEKGNDPVTGDVILEFSADSAGTTPDEIRESLGKSADFVDANNTNLTNAIATEEANEKAGKPRRPWRAGAVQHVCFFIQKENRPDDDTEVWITVDGGQGDRLNQRTKWKKKRITRDPKKGLLITELGIDPVTRKEIEIPDGALAATAASTVDGVDVPARRARTRYVAGWLNIDGIPQLLRAEGSESHINVQKNNAGLAPPATEAKPPTP